MDNAKKSNQGKKSASGTIIRTALIFYLGSVAGQAIYHIEQDAHAERESKNHLNSEELRKAFEQYHTELQQRGSFPRGLNIFGEEPESTYKRIYDAYTNSK